jgi:hypothetical protein
MKPLAQEYRGADEWTRIRGGVLRAYRWQYIFSGVEDPRFQELVGRLVNPDHGRRLQEALSTLM